VVKNGAEQRRNDQRERLISAAEQQIAENGLRGLHARTLAAEIGVAVGAIYNLVDDLDELILRVASRTLALLRAALSEAAHADSAGPTAELIALALAYRRFASANYHRWRALFEHRMRDGQTPDWALEDQANVFAHLLRPLSNLLPTLEEPELGQLANTLFGAVHGVVILGHNEAEGGTPEAGLDDRLAHLVTAICLGLPQAQAMKGK